MLSLRFWQVFSCCVAGFSYVAVYLVRKPLGVVKADLESNYHLTKNQMGWMDTSFFFPYALTQIFCSNVGDRYGARRTITFNLVVTSLSMITFGFWDSTLPLCCLMFVSACAQATLWPNCVKCISDWFPDHELATVFGLMGIFIFGGGIAGTSLAVYLQNLYSPDLRLIFMVPSIICMFMAAAVHLVLKTPAEMDINVTGKNEIETTKAEKESGSEKGERHLTFMETWRIPLVAELSFTMFGIKLVRYCLYMWLPLYLHQSLKYDKSTAGYLSNAFEIGCVVGGPSLGFFIDKFLGGRMHWGVFFSIIGSAISLLAFILTASHGIIANFLCLFMVGALQAGPDLIVSGALAVDVGKRENAQAAVSGIVNGFGSVGTIVEGPMIAFIVTWFGWGGSFYGMIFLTLIGAVAMGKAAIVHGRYQSQPSTI